MGLRRILIVVSDRGIRETLCAMVDIMPNLHASAAENAETAIEILGREPFDLVVSETYLPGINGIKFAKIIKNRGGPLVVLRNCTERSELTL